jgi:hypothetical protein
VSIVSARERLRSAGPQGRIDRLRTFQ